MRAYRGGDYQEYGPTDARDWLTSEPDVCANGHPIHVVGRYRRTDGRQPECVQCRREAVARFRAKVRILDGGSM